MSTHLFRKYWSLCSEVLAILNQEAIENMGKYIVYIEVQSKANIKNKFVSRSRSKNLHAKSVFFYFLFCVTFVQALKWNLNVIIICKYFKSPLTWLLYLMISKGEWKKWRKMASGSVRTVVNFGLKCGGSWGHFTHTILWWKISIIHFELFMKFTNLMKEKIILVAKKLFLKWQKLTTEALQQMFQKSNF